MSHMEDTFKTMKNALCNEIINLANYTPGNTELQRGLERQPFKVILFNTITFRKLKKSLNTDDAIKSWVYVKKQNMLTHKIQ